MSQLTTAPLGTKLYELQELRRLSESEGWKILCEKFEARLLILEARIFDIATPATEAEILRHTRISLASQFSPATLLHDTLAALESRADYELKKRSSHEHSE